MMMATEKRLIDADALIGVIDGLKSELPGWEDYNTGIDSAVYKVENAPTVDAVEVVRCRGCKSYDIKGFVPDAHKGWCMELKQVVKGDFFCAYGEQEAPEGERSRDTEKRSVLL